MLQHNTSNTKNLHIKSSDGKHLSASTWCMFEHWFSPTPFLWSLMLRTCERTSSAIFFKEVNYELCCQHSTMARIVFRFLVFKRLGQADCDIGSFLAKWTINFEEVTIILVSSHKVLTFREPVLQCFLTGLLLAGTYVGLFPKILDPNCITSVVQFTWEP